MQKQFAAPAPAKSGAPQANKIYDVQIAGIPLKLRSTHDEETVNRLISLVDDKVKQAMNLTKSTSFQNSLLLAALHIAEDLLNLKSTMDTELQSLESRTLQMISDIETSTSKQ